MVLVPQGLSSVCLFKRALIAKLMFGFILLVHPCKGQFLETNPPQLVTARVGDSVVLPCHLGVAGNPDQLVVEWARLDLNPRFVYVWFEGRELLDDQNIAYKGRTSLFPDRLKHGDVSLRLTGARHFDNGRFRCYDPNETKEYFVNLLIGSVSSPSISLAGLAVSNSGVMLDCSSAGWYPEPEIYWLDGEGNRISAEPTEKIRDPDGLYTVSSRVTVEKRHNNNITCRVQQKDITQTRETHLYVEDGFFILQSGCSVSISFSVILGLIILIGAATFIWKWRQTKILVKKQKDKVEEKRQKLMVDEKQHLTKTELKLEEELKRRKEDQGNIDHLIEGFIKMSETLEEQKKRLTDQKEEAPKIIDENEKKLKAVDDEVENEKKNKMEKKVQGYLKLKQILIDTQEKLDERRKDYQEMELTTQKLKMWTSEEISKLKERKQENEKSVVEIKQQLEEIEKINQ